VLWTFVVTAGSGGDVFRVTFVCVGRSAGLGSDVSGAVPVP
jgi:hypothetical protein